MCMQYRNAYELAYLFAYTIKAMNKMAFFFLITQKFKLCFTCHILDVFFKM